MPAIDTKPKTKIFELKAIDFEGEGKFKGVFATLNVVDADGDITLPGAFGNQKVLISQYNHGSWERGVQALPIGVGVIYEDGDKAIVEGEIDTDDEAAVKTFKKMKYLQSKGRVQELSYSLPKIDFEYSDTDNGQRVRVLKKIMVNEVSPVLMGAGINTNVFELKTAKTAIKSHSTATSEEAWSAAKNEKRVKGDQARSYYSKIYAWYDPDGEVGVKSTYKFIHHEVSEDGTPGPANLRALSAGIAVLNGGRGGANIPDSERKGVWNHLAKHLKDADREVPELRSIDSTGHKMSLIEHIEFVMTDIEEVIERIEEISKIREGKGRKFSESSLPHVIKLNEVIKDLSCRLEKIIVTEDSDIMKELLKFEKILFERRI